MEAKAIHTNAKHMNRQADRMVYRPSWKDACMHELVARCSKAFPDKDAVLFEGSTLSYRELESRSTKLAIHLQQQGVGPEMPVPLCVERSLEMIIGLYGILKAGGAYVPIDPHFPQSRIDYILGDIGSKVAVSSASLVEKVMAVETVLNLEKHSTQVPPDGKFKPPEVQPDHLAYIIYTSGSTGKPKGVCIEHRNIVSYTEAICDRLNLYESRSHATTSSLAADAGNTAVFPALTTGGTLHVLSQEQVTQPWSYLDYIEQHRPDTLKIVPALLATLQGDEAADKVLPRRHLILGSESAQREWILNWAEGANGCQINNHYGPTETTVGVSTFKAGTHIPKTDSNSLPIGTALDNSELHVVDEDLNPVAAGQPGELIIGGSGVGRGYWKHPEKTAEAFISRSFSGDRNGRYYRSGDRCQLLTDGSIEFLGRIDDQVKIRGNRVELGEIQNTILKFPSVMTSAVITEADSLQSLQVLAYVVARDGESIDEAALRHFLNDRLPDYMLPSRFIVLKRMPQTPNGKVDRDALRAIARETPVSSSKPGELDTETERRLAEIWKSLLSLTDVDPGDSFLVLGGSSLQLIRLIAIIRAQFKVQLSFKELMTVPTLSGMAALIDGKEPEDEPEDENIVPLADRSQVLPLSSIQRQILLESIRNEDLPIYNEVSTIHLGGPVDPQALQKALNALVARHEIFRTGYDWDSGEFSQTIQPHCDVDLPLVDFRNDSKTDPAAKAEGYAAEWSAQLFDLKKPPLIRAFLGVLGENDWRLYLTIHHITTDAHTTFEIVIRELAAHYQAISQGNKISPAALPVQYADFALWQQKKQRVDNEAPALTFWKRKLGDHQGFEYPTDRPRPKQLVQRGAKISTYFGRELSAAIEDYCSKQNTTRFQFLLSAFYATLHRITGESHIQIGTVTAGRNQGSLDKVAGCFINYLPISAEIKPADTFADLHNRVSHTLFEAIEHQNISLVDLAHAIAINRDPSRKPFYQVMFLMETPQTELPLAWTHSRQEFHPGGSKLDITFEMDERDGEIFGRVEYNTELYFPETVERLIHLYQTVIRSILSSPNAKVSTLSLLDSKEQEKVLDAFNDTAKEIDAKLRLQDGLARYAKETPEAVAVIDDETSMSYAELDNRAHNLAVQLQESGLQPESVVAVIVRRSANLPVALFGVLKAGGAFLPVDPDQPRERIEYLLEDSGAALALVNDAGDVPDSFDGPSYNISELARSDSEAPLRDAVEPNHLAYVIYTSGSTGKPKGAMVEHRSIVNRLLWMADNYAFNQEDIQIQKTPITFDVSVHEHFLWSMVGGRVIIPKPGCESEPDVLVDYINRYQVTTVHFVPSMLEAFLEYLSVFGREDQLVSLRDIFCSGEVLPTKTVNTFREKLGNAFNTRIHNLYGPTEAAVDVTYFDCSDFESGSSVPIGKGVWNTQLYILDKQLMPLPVGCKGELYIGGVQVGRGYLNKPEQTEQAFISNPFSSDPTQRIYKTGDQAKWLPDGTIEYLGRNDFQIKIRGVRVELAEIDEAIRSIPGVASACSKVHREEDGLPQLIGYYTCKQGHPVISEEELAGRLSDKLPSQMVPKSLVHLDEFHLNASGKLDRSALPIPKVAAPATASIVGSEEERILSEAWREVLKVKRAGSKDDFFELGGDSILAIQTLSALRRKGYQVSLKDVFSTTRLEDLAVKMSPLDSQPKIQDLEDCHELIPIQNWLLNLGLRHPAHWNHSRLIEFNRMVDIQRLEEAIRKLVEVHVSLKTRFKMKAGKWEQAVDPTPESSLLSVVDLTGDTVEEKEEQLLGHCRSIQSSFSLEDGLLFKATCFHYSEKLPGKLFIAAHHLIIDSVSWGIIEEDLSQTYQALDENKPCESLSESASFLQWSAALQRYAKGSSHNEAAEYWSRIPTNRKKVLPGETKTETTNTPENARCAESYLTERETRQLIREVPAAYNTEVNDALLTALCLVLQDKCQASEFCFFMEGHGREAIEENLDISRTVGWFATLYPAFLSGDFSEAESALKSVKEQLRAIPDRGIGYGLSGNLQDVSKKSIRPEFIVNYLGRVDERPQNSNLVKQSSRIHGTDQNASDERICDHEVLIRIENQRLKLTWWFNSRQHSQEQMEELVGEVLNKLRTIIHLCLEENAGGYTISDFQSIELSQDELEDLLEEFEDSNS